MTMPVENSRIIFQGDGGTVTFHYPDTFWADSELEVVLVRTADYSETILDPIFYDLIHPVWPPFEGCDIRYPSTNSSAPVLAADQQLVVYRKTALDQQTELNNQSAYYLETIEKTFDRIVRQLQEMEDDLRRSPQVPVSVPIDVDVVMGLPEPGEFIRWAEDGSYSLETYPLNDFDSQEWIDAWHREYYSQVAEDNIAVEQGWIEPTTANWNGITTPGYYSYIDALNSGMTNTPPNLSPSGMLTVTSSYSHVLQVYCNSADNSKYSRIHYNGTWQAWEPIGGMVDQGIIDIGTGGDVDVLNEVGIYYIVDGAATPPDPVTRGLPQVSSATGILSVEETEGQMRQHFSALGAPDSGRSFIRTYFTEDGYWGAWKETTGVTHGELEGLLIGELSDNHVPVDYGRIGNVEDWNTITYPSYKWYDQTFDLGQANKAPQTGANGILITEQSSNNVLRQVYSANISNVPVTCVRAAYWDAEWQWSAWITVGDDTISTEWHQEYYSQVDEDNLQVEKGSMLNTSQNWNNLKTPGWWKYSNINDVAMSNAPPNKGVQGILSVEVTEDIVKQIYTHSLEPMTTATRTFANNVWTEWSVDATGEYIPGESEWVGCPSEVANSGHWWFDVCNFEGSNHFMAVGQTELGVLPPRIARSTDGENFFEVTLPSTFNDLDPKAIHGIFGKVVVLGQNIDEYAQAYGGIYSEDGIDWAWCSGVGSRDWKGITHGNGYFSAVSFSADAACGAYSSDGVAWASFSMPSTNLWLRDVKFANGVFIAIGGNSGQAAIVRATSAWSYSLVWFSSGASLTGVAYGNGRWVAVSLNDGTNRIVYSDNNGQTWTYANTLPAYDFQDITFRNGLFIAVATTAEYSSIFYISDDGINWAEEETFGLNIVQALASGPDNTVAVGNGIGTRITTEGSSIDLSAALVPVDTTLFNGVLSSTDDNVQKALNTLDDHTHPVQPYDHTHSAEDIVLPDDWTPPGGDITEPIGAYNWYCGSQFPVTESLTATAKDPDTGRIVVVGYGSYPDLIWYTDDDGITWTSAGAPGDMEVSWMDVAFGNGRWVAVCNDSPDHVVAYSDDGINWTVPDTQAGNNSYIAVEFGANGYFVAIADGGGQDVLYSSDGALWYMATSGLGFTPVDLCYAQGWFYVIGNYGSDMGGFARSTNGAGWFMETTIGSPGTFNAIAANDDVIVAVMQASSTQARYSADGGANWQGIDTSGLSSTQQWWQGIAWGDGMFMAVGSRTGYDQVMTSENGVDWTNPEFPCAGISWDSVHYLDDDVNKAFILFNLTNGPYNLSYYYYEEEAQGEWELGDNSQAFVASLALTDSVYHDGRWVVIGRDNYPNNFFYSDDGGETFNVGSYAGQDVQWISVCYGADGFYATAAYGAAAGCICKSTDGINWADVPGSVAGEFQAWDGIAYANGVYVACSSNPTNTNILRSTDGVTWDLVDLGQRFNLYDVCYWDKVGLFVAVGNAPIVETNYDTCVLTSPDGLTWTLRTDGSDQYRLKAVAFDDNIILAVCAEGCLYSEDAVNWTISTGFPAGDWNSVAYGNGKFVAVSCYGTYLVAECTNGEDWTSMPLPEANWWRINYGNNDFCILSWDNNPYNIIWYRGPDQGGTPIPVETPFHAAFIEVYTGDFDNNLMADPPLDTVQKCLDYIDDMELAGGGGSSNASDIVVDGSNLDGNLAGIDLNVQAAIDAIDDLTVGGLVIDTTNFDDILSPAESTVQACLDVLDDHRHPAARITLTTTDFDGVLGVGTTNVQLAMDLLDDHTHATDDVLPDTSTALPGDVLTWNGTQFIWQAPPSIGTITAGDIALDTTNLDGILDGTIQDVQAAIDALDDHGHDATDIGTVTSNFDGLFSSTQNTVQKCLDVLDDHTHTLAAANVTVNVTAFDGVLSTADTELQHALDTIDDHTHPMEEILPPLDGVTSGVLGTDGETIYWADPQGASILLNVTNFDGILDGTCTEVQTAMDLLDDHYHTNNTPKCGFEDRSQSTLPDTMTDSGFFLTGTYQFHVNGIAYEDTDGAVDIGSSHGYHYIWYDVDGVMQSSEIKPPIDYKHCLVATVMWNGTEGFVIDQRHISTRNADLAAMMDDTVGARYGDGFDATFTDSAFSIGAGHYWDEDLRYDIPVTTNCRVMYRETTDWTWTDQQAEYYIDNAGVMQWDNLGTLSEVPDGSYMAMWVYATGDVLNKIWMLCGQRTDGNIDDAREQNDLPGLSLPGSVRDARLLYRVILQQVGTTPTYVETRDYRKANVINGNEIVKGDHLYLENTGTMTHLELEQALADIGAAGYMNWKGRWVPALYEVGDTVSDDQWTMVATTQTIERPAPQPVGDLFWVREEMGEPAWEDGSTTTNVLYLGQRYNFTESFRISTIRTYHNASAIGLNVEVWAVMSPGTDDERIVNILPGRVLEAEDLDTWQQFSIGGLYVEAGSVVDLLKIVRPSTGQVTFTHSWAYELIDGDPGSGQIYHQGGSSLDEIRVHAVDDGGTDRSAELDNIGPGSTITMVSGSYIWEVISASKTGSIYTFTVDPGTRAKKGTSDFTFMYLAAIPINYVYNTDLFSSYPNVSGYFASEYLPNEAAYLNDNGYGLDIQVQNMTSSEDWDVVAYPPSGAVSAGGGAAGGGGDAVDIAVDATNFNGVLGATDLNVQQALDTIDDHQHTEADITDLDKYTQAQVNSMMDAKAPLIHQHAEADITDLDKYSTSEVDTALAGKADLVHTHDLLHMVSNLTTDLSYSGNITTATVSANGLGVGALLYLGAAGLELADADAIATMPVVAMACEAGTGELTVLLEGFLRNDSWSFTKNQILYASTTTGEITATAPGGYQDQLQTIGIAWASNIVYFRPSLVLAQIGLF